jgi:hypothetical protein
MSYYWYNHEKHTTGDIILPGNWGRVIKANPGHRYYRMEQQFETMRLSINSALPSRLESAFVFEDIKTANVLQVKQPGGVLYEVMLIDKDKSSYRTEMALIHPELEIYNAQVGNPKKYWGIKPGDVLQWPEILTLSRLKIIKVLQSSH